MTRNQVITWLTTNCQAWHNSTPLLQTMPTESLTRVYHQAVAAQQAEVVANAAITGFQHGGNAYTYDPSLGGFVANAMPAPQRTAPRVPPPTDEDDEEEIEDPAVPPQMRVPRYNAGGDNINPDHMTGFDNRDAYPKEVGRKNPDAIVKPTGNSAIPPQYRSGKRNLSIQEALPLLNREAQEVWNHAQEVHKQTKVALIAKIVANREDNDEKAALVNYLESKSIPELQMIQTLQPTVNTPEYAPLFSGATPAPNYLGAATPPAYNYRTEEDKDDILPLPTINWAQEAGASKAAN